MHITLIDDTYDVCAPQVSLMNRTKIRIAESQWWKLPVGLHHMAPMLHKMFLSHDVIRNKEGPKTTSEWKVEQR